MAVDPLTLTLASILAILLLGVWFIARKGRRLPGPHVFRASRLSRGNRLLPAQVAVTPTSITHYRPQWIGRLEESIHISHVASVRIDTNILFSDVFIESTGGRNPIECYGHGKGDAVEMKRLVEQYQSEFYRTGERALGGGGPVHR
jgi:hypothetical protein